MLVVLAVTGCSHENDERAQRPHADRPPTVVSASERDEPSCEQVWVVGEPLPVGYTGCERDGRRILPETFRCNDRSGRELVSYPDEGLYAQLGSTIKELELPADLSGSIPSIDLCGHRAPVDLTLDCEGRQSSEGVFDYVPPRSAAQAHRQDWPRSPREAVAGMLAADAFRSLGAVELSRGVASNRRGAMSVDFAALSSTGATIAVISVDRLFPAVWAVSGTEQCA